MKRTREKEEFVVPVERIENQIYLIRGVKVMLDADLADLYQILTKNLNLAVRRNRERFPEDFMFQLTRDEFKLWWTPLLAIRIHGTWCCNALGGAQ